MIVHVATYLASIGGSMDKDKYLRPLPGRPGWAAVCHKPKYSKKKQKEMAEREQVKKFTDVNARASAIYHDAEKREEWAQRHREALREASRHQKVGKDGKPAVPVRLWDYIKRSLYSPSPLSPEGKEGCE